MLFLDEYEKNIQKFRDPKVKKKNLWITIAAVMAENGYVVNASLLDQKLRNMKCTFNKIRDNKKASKTGRGRIQWPYYERMEQIFLTDKTVNLPKLVSTLVCHKDPETSPLMEQTQNKHTDTNKKNLDGFRKRQLEIEEERLEELKKIRKEVEETNRLNREKFDLMKKYFEKQ